MLRCGHDCVASSEVRGAKVEETVKNEVMYKWLPVIVEDACTGCGLCVAACGPACLETQNLVAILTRPEDCGRRALHPGLPRGCDSYGVAAFRRRPFARHLAIRGTNPSRTVLRTRRNFRLIFTRGCELFAG